MKTSQEPTVRVEDHPTATKDDQILEHPAYAVISAHRINGQFDLFDSNIINHGAVQIEIHEARHYVGPYHRRTHPGKLIAEVMLSEAQWVAFVSRMNMGSGTPCTLRYTRDGNLVDVPALPKTQSAADRLRATADVQNQKHREASKAAMAKIDAICDTLPKGKAKEIRDALTQVGYSINENHEFAREVLMEDTERLITEAKVELDATLQSMVTTTGIKALSQQQGMLDGGTDAPIDVPFQQIEDKRND